MQKLRAKERFAFCLFARLPRECPPAKRGTPELSAPRKRVCLWPEPIPPGQRIYEIATNTAGNAVPAGKMILEEIVIELE
jgi:hypothetical protein